MIKQIFVNLPVKDLDKTKEFWTKLGFGFNPQFTDEKAGALELGENIFAMLVTEPFYKTFIKKEIADSSKTSEVINAISVETRENVDELVNKAIEAGGKIYRNPDDYGWMYNRSFEDLDGHLWEVVHMDITKAPANPGAGN
ncbi:MAG TPA: VOC family protein [Patescibacteria group bacterium]|nr:VOC family protein [Patescibacteria group bacterium]